MTDDFEAKCKELCPHCAAGEAVRQRPDTKEFVHDFLFASPLRTGSHTLKHCLCSAHDFRSKNE